MEKTGNINKTAQFKDTFITTFRLLKLTWQVDRRMFIGSAVVVLVPSVTPFLNAYIAKLIINFVVSALNQSAINWNQLYLLLGLSLAVYFISDLAFNTQNFVHRLLWTKFPIYLNQVLYKKTAHLDVQYFENSDFNDLLDKVRDSANFRPPRVVDSALLVMQGVIQIGVTLGIVARLNWLLIPLILAIAVPEFIQQTYHSKLSWGIWSKNTPERKRFFYLSYILQSSHWIKEIKLFKLADKFLKEIKETQEKFYRENTQIAKKEYLSSALFGILSAGVLIGIQFYVIVQVLVKKLTVGDIGFYGGIIGNFQNSLGGLFRNLNDIYESSLYIQSIFDVLDTEPIITSDPHATILPRLKKAPLIEFRNVDFTYPDSKKNSLKDFSLVIKPGEKIAFVGENGAGKTTAIKLLTRFYDVSQGEILINGQNLKEINLESWYQNVGVLFQDFNRYEHTVEENINFGDIHRHIELPEIITAATSAGAHEMISKLDAGYQQMLGRNWEKGAELSTGQWQRIALARAFLRNAPVLVLDEPTSAIDAKAEAEIFSRVEKLSREKSVIIISHRFSTVRNADRIYVIDKGKITESGNHEQLMKLNGKYASLFRLQARAYQ
ncbi:ABC transporter ATP-binding protein/permease [Patescibacteria group bacterium]|nr:ABC transporter ATP-binding protein/permease [Patescibacteria group bacterium]MCL5409956.1 ABC transporter ATP-binding protein/permease [Patescibacteria group bacterium]